MNKTVKNILILVAGIAVIYSIMRIKDKEQPVKIKNKPKEKEEKEETKVKEPIICPESHLICESNHEKCFDPNIQYTEDPCK